jgi:hypothetical protein
MLWEPREYISTSREDLVSAPHLFYFDYWRRKRGTQRMPAAFDVRTSDFAYVDNVALLHVLPDRQDFRCQLLGGRIAEYLSTAATGRSMREILEPWRFPDSFTHAVIRSLQRVCEVRGVMRLKFPARTWRGHLFSAFEALSFPLADEEGGVGKLLIVVSFADEWRRQPPVPFRSLP